MEKEEVNPGVEALRAENAELKERLNRLEEWAAVERKSGRAEVQKEEPKEETPQEYAKRVLSGRI